MIDHKRMVVAWRFYFRAHVVVAGPLAIYGYVLDSWLIIGWAAFIAIVSLLWLAFDWRVERQIAQMAARGRRIVQERR